MNTSKPSTFFMLWNLNEFLDKLILNIEWWMYEERMKMVLLQMSCCGRVTFVANLSNPDQACMFTDQSITEMLSENIQNVNFTDFVCNLCGKGFVNRGSLYNHRSQNHRDAIRKYSKYWNHDVLQIPCLCAIYVAKNSQKLEVYTVTEHEIIEMMWEVIQEPNNMNLFSL